MGRFEAARAQSLILVLSSESLFDLIGLGGDFEDAPPNFFGGDRRAGISIDHHEHLLPVDFANRETAVQHDHVLQEGLLVVAGSGSAAGRVQQKNPLVYGVWSRFGKNPLLSIPRQLSRDAIVFAVAEPRHGLVISKGFDQQRFEVSLKSEHGVQQQ